MTKEQVKKYYNIEKEIQPLRALMELCGDKYRIKSLDHMWRMFMYTTKKRLHLRTNEPNCIEFSTVIPKELQTEIVAVIENYIERREKEMEEL